MPSKFNRKKKTEPKEEPQVAPVIQPDPVEEKIAELVKNNPNVCNHRNQHATGEVLCILNKGHDGAHQNGNQAWSDAAGEPTRKHA
jgi:hypothetical protein